MKIGDVITFNPYSDLSEVEQLTKQEIADLWVSDLRQYPEIQGYGYLDYGGKRCCLGQLCYIASLYNVCYVSNLRDRIFYDNNSSFVPTPVQKWAGIYFENAKLIDHPLHGSLSSMNDAYIPWSEIADVIESRHKGLFTWN